VRAVGCARGMWGGRQEEGRCGVTAQVEGTGEEAVVLWRTVDSSAERGQCECERHLPMRAMLPASHAFFCRGNHEREDAHTHR